MNKFISKSQYNKKILQSAMLSINLPVNILIIGNNGVGKKLLAQDIVPDDCEIYEAIDLENLINSSNINIKEYKILVIHNIHKLVNKNEFLKNCSGVKLICTTTTLLDEFYNVFSIKLNLKDLQDNEEDLLFIKEKYIKEASKLLQKDIDNTNIEIDLSNNGISLKQSIYKSIFYSNMNDDDLKYSLEKYFQQEVQNNKTYYNLLEIYEVPLIKAAKKVFKSQVKISNALDINRVTLRKKISKYFGNNDE